jgi:hypothetical protein
MLRMSPLRGDRSVATPAAPGRLAAPNQARLQLRLLLAPLALRGSARAAAYRRLRLLYRLRRSASPIARAGALGGLLFAGEQRRSAAQPDPSGIRGP